MGSNPLCAGLFALLFPSSKYWCSCYLPILALPLEIIHCHYALNQLQKLTNYLNEARARSLHHMKAQSPKNLSPVPARAFFSEQRKKTFIRQLFSHFLFSGVVSTLLAAAAASLLHQIIISIQFQVSWNIFLRKKRRIGCRSWEIGNNGKCGAGTWNFDRMIDWPKLAEKLKCPKLAKFDVKMCWIVDWSKFAKLSNIVTHSLINT